MFADLWDSSRLFRVLGDDQARAVVVKSLEVARVSIEAAGGTVVDTIGDELFCAFPDGDSAARGGVDLQEATTAARDQGLLPQELRFRVGLCHGPVGVDGSRVYGTTVHLARRVASLAKPDQVLTTGETLRRMRAIPESRLVEYTHVKGQPDLIEVVEIVWGTATTIDISRTLKRVAVREELVLTLPGEEGVVVSMTNPAATLGRDPACDLRVEAECMSRLHARVELRHGEFLFVDISRNGSKVTSDDSAPRFVNRGEVTLGKRGAVRFGSDSDGPVVFFRRRPSGP